MLKLKAQTDIVTLIHTTLYEGMGYFYIINSSEGSHVNLGQHECE